MLESFLLKLITKLLKTKLECHRFLSNSTDESIRSNTGISS